MSKDYQTDSQQLRKPGKAKGDGGAALQPQGKGPEYQKDSQQLRKPGDAKGSGGAASQPGGSSGAGYQDDALPHESYHKAGTPHTFKPPANGSCGFGHAAHVRSGALRLSGHSGAHRIGKRK